MHAMMGEQSKLPILQQQKKKCAGENGRQDVALQECCCAYGGDVHVS